MTDNTNAYKFIAIAEAIGSCIKDFQVAVERRTFWRGCKHYVQLWVMYFDFHTKLIFEEWHYEWNNLRLVLGIRRWCLCRKNYLVVLRFSLKRGRHWDRKRRNG